jgi:hypothetical protein
MEFLTVRQMCVLLHWREKDVMAALSNGTLVGVQSPLNQQWAIVHPGIQFVEYLRHPERRMPHVPLLGVFDVVAITGTYKSKILRAMKKGQLKPANVPPYRCKGQLRKHLFTPWEVRRYMIETLKREDPLVRPPITLDVLVQWFHHSLTIAARKKPEQQVADEIHYIISMPEPERSRHFAELERKVVAARQLTERAIKQQAEASA